MLERALASMRSMRAATSAEQRRRQAQDGRQAARRHGRELRRRDAGRRQRVERLVDQRREAARGSRAPAAASRSGRPDSALTGLFRLSSSLPHWIGSRSACRSIGTPARSNTATQGRSARSSLRRQPAGRAAVEGAGRRSRPRCTAPCPAARAAPARPAPRRPRSRCRSAATAPACRPAAPRASSAAASAVAPLFTVSSTSDGPRARGHFGPRAAARRAARGAARRRGR